MGFLAPAFLALSALVAVPLLVHLLRRRIARRVEFPAVRYLERMEQEHSRDLKLKNRLLLLLRLLAVLALALAAARPIARLAGFGHAPVALAMVIDNSMSSGAIVDGVARLDVLKRDARALMATLDVADRAWLVTADGRVIGGSHDAVQQALDALVPIGGRGSLDLALRRAVALARSGAPRAGIVALASDGQANAFSASADSAIRLGDVPLLALVPEWPATPNRAVVAATPEPERWTPSGILRIAVASPDSASFRVVLEGRTVARGSAVPATVARPAEMELRLSSASTGWLPGYVEVDPDALRADNRRYFAVRVAPPPTIAMRSEAGMFLAAALGTLVDEQRVTRVATATGTAITVTGADASGVRLPALLVAPSDPVQVGAANRELARLGIPWRFGAIARNGVTARMEGQAGGSDSAAVVRARTALDGARVLLRYPLMRSGGGGANAADTSATTVLVTAGGAPWIVTGRGYVLVGSPIDPDATDLPLRAGFVPWLLETLSRQLGSDGMLLQVRPGERLGGAGGLVGITAIEAIAPRDSAPGADATTRSVASAPHEPGVYLLRRNAERVGALVVNAEPEESELQQADAGTFLSHVDGRTIEVMSTGAQWRQRVLSQAEGRALLIPLVATALLLLALEAWFARMSIAPSTPAPRRDAAARRAA